MAENENQNTKDPTNNVGDILGSQQDTSAKLDRISLKLDQTNKYLANIARMSQSSARDTYEEDRHFRDEYKNKRSDKGRYSDGRNATGSRPGAGMNFSDAIKRQFTQSLFGFDLKNPLQGVMSNLAKQMGVEVRDIPGVFGNQLGQELASAIKNNPIGSKFVTKLNDIVSGVSDKISSKFSSMNFGQFSDNVPKPESSENLSKDLSENADNLSDTLSGAAKSALSSITGAAQDGGAALEQGMAAAGQNLGQMSGLTDGAIGALKKFTPALIAVQIGMKLLSPVIEGARKVFEFWFKREDREYTRQKEILKNTTTRIGQDVDTLVRRPFQILEEAANALYQSWSNSINVINQTQGYDKNQLMALMSRFAERLRNEGLSSVVAGTDIVSALEQVLKSGLSGAIAEEFAYQAVKLNAAVPTQDFFSFASSYASVAANAIKNGKSQSEAIAEANKSLEDFTSDLLYASRELTGGFTTGLQNASNLYEQSIKIAQAARTNNASEISGVLTSVSAIIGAIAPDLTSSLTDAIYSAATGGNSSNLVALRSLAGVNASNTEFLKAFAKSPQKIISNMFTNLGNMYSQSPDAFMEKAEGYADLFGLSAEAFQRVDFNYLAEQISRMNSSNNSLAENLSLLASGQSTSTAEQEKANQINQYMIDQGLSYMIDNQVAQAIQQHMWDQEIADALMDATYGIELVGESKRMFADIAHEVSETAFALFTLGIGPAVRSANQTKQAIEENSRVMADVAQVVLSTRVGSGGDNEVLKLLTGTGGVGSMATPSYVEMLGGKAFYTDRAHILQNLLGDSNVSSWIRSAVVDGLKASGRYGNYLEALSDQSSVLNWLEKFGIQNSQYNTDMRKDVVDSFRRIYNNQVSRRFSQDYIPDNSRSSVYNSWGGLTSKYTNQISDSYLKYTRNSSEFDEIIASNSKVSSVSSAVAAKLDKFLSKDSIKAAISEGMNFEDWLKSSSESGVKDVTKFGKSLEDLQDIFNEAARELGQEKLAEKSKLEEAWYREGTKYVTETFWSEFKDPISTQLTEFQQQVNSDIERFIFAFNLQLTIANAHLLGANETLQKTYDYLSTIGVPLIHTDIALLVVPSINTVNNSVRAVEDAVKSYNPFIIDKWSAYTKDWNDRWKAYSSYFLEHKIYGSGNGKLKISKLEEVQQAEKKGKGDVVNALAEYLTTNSWNLEDLQDPQIQTNALLSQILIVLNAIMNQNNTKNVGWTLSDTLSSLATGRPL